MEGKRIDRLTQSSTRGVIWRCRKYMVAAIMFDAEMPVGGCGRCNFGQQLLYNYLLVA